MKPPVIVGHRGSPFSAVENTGASFRAALSEGASVIETDVRLTLDGHVVVSHDPDFSRFGGPVRPVRACRRSELESLVLRSDSGETARPLFMDEALTSFPGTVFNVDLKDPGRPLVAAWSELLKRSGASERCRTASFRDRTLRLFHRISPSSRTSLARFAVFRLLLGTMIGRPRAPRPWEGVLQLPERSLFLRVVTPPRIRAWQSRGWEVQIWTVDREEDMRRLVEWGVDGIITNRPSLLKDVLESMIREGRA